MKIKRTLLAIAGLLLLANLSGCGFHIPPSAEGFNVAPPAAATVKPVPESVVEYSNINLPVSVSLSPLLNQVNEAVPESEDHDRGDKDWIVIANLENDIGYRYYWQRTPFTLNVKGDNIDASTEILYRGRRGLRSIFGWRSACCGCGNEWPLISKVGLTTKLSFKNDWSIESHSAAKPVNASKYRCHLTGVDFQITDRISVVGQKLMKNTAARVDSFLRKNLNLKQQGERAWQAMQSPIPVSDGVHLIFNPQSVHVTPFNGQGDRLNFSIWITGKPKLIAGNSPPASTLPLPGVSIATPKNGFHIALSGELPFDFVSDKLARRLEGRTYIMAGNKVFIEKVRLYGIGESAIMVVKIKGTVKGTIYLTGIPAYDNVDKMLYIRNLDYTPETRQVLAQVADWLLRSQFRQSLADQAKWSIKDQVDGSRNRLQQALNRNLNDHVRMSGRVLEIRPVAVGMTATSLKAVLIADGTAELSIF